MIVEFRKRYRSGMTKYTIQNKISSVSQIIYMLTQRIFIKYKWKINHDNVEKDY